LRKKSHTMDIWSDMIFRVDKTAKMGTNSTISRTDFKRLSEVHEALEKMNFIEVRVTRRKMPLTSGMDETDVLELLKKLTDSALRAKAIEALNSLKDEELRKAVLVLYAYAKKEILV